VCVCVCVCVCKVRLVNDSNTTEYSETASLLTNGGWATYPTCFIALLMSVKDIGRPFLHPVEIALF
jgi:hypothetical protein